MRRWRIQFIYQSSDGETRITEETVKAESRDAASAIATTIRPSTECVFSVHPESEDQYLNTVKLNALDRSGKAWKPSE